MPLRALTSAGEAADRRMETLRLHASARGSHKGPRQGHLLISCGNCHDELRSFFALSNSGCQSASWDGPTSPGGW